MKALLKYQKSMNAKHANKIRSLVTQEKKTAKMKHFHVPSGLEKNIKIIRIKHKVKQK